MKIAMIGVGRVGSATAFSLIRYPEIDEMVLVDIKEDLLRGEYLDLLQASKNFNPDLKLSMTSNVADVKDSDINVVTAGFPMGVQFKSRMDLIEKNYPIIKDIFTKLPKNSITILTTNPVDVMTYLALKVSGNKREKVFGMGSLLDTYRFRTIIPDGKVIGEHGDSMVFIPNISKEKKDSIRFMSKEISQGKGGTQWAPASALSSIVEGIIKGKKFETLASVYLNGEYGIKDVCLGVPVIIGRDGIEKIVEIDLKPEEHSLLKKSADIVKSGIFNIEHLDIPKN